MPGNGTEYAIEMREIGESGECGDLRNIVVCFHEKTFGIHDPGPLQIFDDGPAGIFAELPAQIVLAHSEAFRKIRNGDFGCVVFVDVTDHLVDAVSAGIFADLCLPEYQNQNHVQNRVHLLPMIISGVILLIEHSIDESSKLTEHFLCGTIDAERIRQCRAYFLGGDHVRPEINDDAGKRNAEVAEGMVHGKRRKENKVAGSCQKDLVIDGVITVSRIEKIQLIEFVKM